MSKTYILFPKILKGEEATIFNLSKPPMSFEWIRGDVVDGIMNYPQTNFGEPLNDN